jgi:cytochrome c5
MIMSSKHLLLALVVLAASPMLSQTALQDHPRTTRPAKKQPVAAHAQQQNEGEHIFQANCTRCHNTPDGFSPHISGTIVRHMRVRASLSRHDEQELLRFFNP